MIKTEVSSKINVTMALGKCEKCKQSVKVKQSRKKSILPLFFLFSGLLILAYDRESGNSGTGLMILGITATVSGFGWLVMTGLRYFRS